MDLEVLSPISAEAEVKAYTLVGDDIYVKRYTNENIPDWYRQLISDIIATDNTITDLDAAVDYLSTLPAGYDQKITELRLADTTINTSLTSLVATTGSHTAAIASLNATKVDATSAAAIAQTTVGSYFASADAGAWFNSKISTYASDIAANAMDISTLSATVDGQTVMIEDISSVSIDPVTGYKLGAAKIGTAPDGSITGWQFADGSNEDSTFKINADKFELVASSQTALAKRPFTVNATTGEITFQGKVSFTSVTDTPPLVAENTNINVTTNLVPNNGWYAEGHADYLFVGTPSYLKMIGAGTFQEDTLLLNVGDEVYTPYISDFTKSYKISYAFKGALIGALFQIDGTTASNANVVLSGTYDPAKWYIVQALVLPNGSTAGTLFGKVQDAVTLNTVAPITDKVLASATDWFCLGFIATADTYISRVSIEVVNTDTVNSVPVTSSNLTTALAATSTVIDGARISTGSVNADRIDAATISASNMLVDQTIRSSDFTTIGGAGFRLKSNAAGTSADPTIYGAYIRGGTLDGTTVSARNLIIVTDSGYATKSVISSPATLLSSTSSTYNIYDDSYTDATTQRIASTESILYFTGETSYFDIFVDEYSTTPFSMSYSGYTILAIHDGYSMTITVNGVSGVLTPPTNGVVTRVINGLTFVSQERTMSGIGSTSYYGVLYIKPINPKPTTMNGQKLSISISGSNGAFRSTSCIVYNI